LPAFNICSLPFGRFTSTEADDTAPFAEVAMLSRRGLLVSAVGAGLIPFRLARAADKPKEIRIDWATYNPVSMVLKEKGSLEKEFENDGIGVRWVQTLGSNKALEFLNAGSIDFGSTAGAAALIGRINGNPIKSI
jgi:sulfonate transport system substrate-binding protein